MYWQLLRRRWECAAKHRLVNEVDPELDYGCPQHDSRHSGIDIFPDCEGREQGYRCFELVIAKCLESRNRQGSRTEWKRQREAQIRVTRLGEMQLAGAQNQSGQPLRVERVLIADDRVEVIVVRGQAGIGQRALLHQCIVRKVTVFRSAQKPLRLGDSAQSNRTEPM